METDLSEVRAQSWVQVRELGLPTHAGLPLLETDTHVREDEEITRRILCLLPLGACAYGFSRDRARSWLEREGLGGHLGPGERAFLEGSVADATPFKLQIEGMWALAWVLGIASALSPTVPCPSNFVNMLPDLKKDESAAAFRAQLRRRSTKDIVSAADLYYCLHWATRQVELDGKVLPGQIRAAVVEERRRALEWVVGTEPWWEVSLDT